MENLFIFLGRFHPLLVHLPIGMLILAFLFEVLSRSPRFKKLNSAVQPSLFWGTLAAIVSVASGYILSLEGGYEDQLVTLHQNFGIATAIFSILLYFIRKSERIKTLDKKRRKAVRLSLFLPLIVLLSATGHLGGSLTHGEDFLTEFASLTADEKPSDPAAKIKLIADVNEAVVYTDVIQPILEARCYSCHSSKKQKGQLRLDAIDLILKGGKHGAVIEAGIADSSSLYSRLMLPVEDKHHMPPEEKPQLSSTEIDLLREWINDGGHFEKSVRDFKDAKKITRSIQLLMEDSEQHSWVPPEKVSPANEKDIEQLRASGALVLPVGTDNHYITVSYVNARSITKKDLELLLPIKDQLLSLRLSYTNANDSLLTTVSKLKRISWLYLDHTKISDKAAPEIAKLTNLQYLNLVGTNVTDSAL
jgi:uncharacterized membrane protein